MKRLILALACLAAIASVPARGAAVRSEASLRLPSIRPVPAGTRLASDEAAAADPHWTPNASVLAPATQKGTAPDRSQNQPASPYRPIELALGAHEAETTVADGRQAEWAVTIRGYQATGPPAATARTPDLNPRARPA